MKMRNPINKRIPRELKSEAGKYVVIFLFMVMLISLVSAFLVTDNSVESAYYEGFTKYNIEDGHLAFDEQADEKLLKSLETKGDLTFTDLRYFEEEVAENGTNLRVYKVRSVVNLECIMSGEIPSGDNEIALDRMYAENNKIAVGDTITIKGNCVVVSGLIAVPDYSCLFESNSDMMFDSVNFGIAVMTDAGFEKVSSTHITYNYAWKYNKAAEDKAEEKQKSDDFLDLLEDELTSYDKAIIQTQIDNLVDEATEIADSLSKDFEVVSEEIETKIKDAATTVATRKLEEEAKKFTEEDVLPVYMENPTLTQEEILSILISKIPEEKYTPTNDEIADELGVDRKVFGELLDKIEEMEDSTELSFESIDVSELDLDEAEDEDVMSTEALDDIKELVSLIEESGLAKTTKLTAGIDEIEMLLEKGIEEDALLEITDYIPKYANKAINFTGEDMGSDKIMFIIFDYIVIVILAFVFAVTTSNTITEEAGVIGTLRASGYTKGEIIRHYMTLPVLVTLIAALVGNILGYTVLKGTIVAMYYNSYSLCTYVTLWSAQAFVITTVYPLIIMFVINFIMIASKLKLSPLRFLRHDISFSRKKKALRLNTKIPFLHRFRLRILLQNIPAYITLFIGIFFAAVIAVFGFMFGPLLNDYADLVVKTKISSYQYVLMDKVETETPGAEKFCVETLDINYKNFLPDEIMIYGIEEESRYIESEIPEGKVLINNGMAAKFGFKEGAVIILKDPYSDKQYEFTVGGIYTYDAALSIFMNRSEFIETFGKEADDFEGYFSNEKLEDIDENDIATVITEADLTKVATQLKKSVGQFMSLLSLFSVAMFMLLMYILTKQIIEKNKQSISMTKILGFTGGEIAGLYLVITSVVVIISLLATVPLTKLVLKWIFTDVLYSSITGYLPFIVANSCYVKTILLGIACYAFVCIFLMIKINRIPKSDALKTVE